MINNKAAGIISPAAFIAIYSNSGIIPNRDFARDWY